jgi:hypothetical protein
MNQMIINFDATGFEGFDSPNDYFAYCSKTARDSEGRPLKQHYQAADMDMSPPQWNQKLNKSNNTAVMLDEAFLYSQKFGDWRWLDYGNWLRAQSDAANVDALIAQREQLDRQIQRAKQSAPALKVAKR